MWLVVSVSSILVVLSLCPAIAVADLRADAEGGAFGPGFGVQCNQNDTIHNPAIATTQCSGSNGSGGGATIQGSSIVTYGSMIISSIASITGSGGVTGSSAYFAAGGATSDQVQTLDPRVATARVMVIVSGSNTGHTSELTQRYFLSAKAYTSQRECTITDQAGGRCDILVDVSGGRQMYMQTQLSASALASASDDPRFPSIPLATANYSAMLTLQYLDQDGNAICPTDFSSNYGFTYGLDVCGHYEIAIDPPTAQVAPTVRLRDPYDLDERNAAYWKPLKFKLSVFKDGRPLPEGETVTVKFKLTNSDGGAGHLHDADIRPTGWLGTLPEQGEEVRSTALGGRDPMLPVPDMQIAGGAARKLLYLAPEISGQDTIDAVIEGTDAKASATVTVKIEGLKKLKPVADLIELTGNCGTTEPYRPHNSCFNLTPFAIGKVKEAAALYQVKQETAFGKEPLPMQFSLLSRCQCAIEFDHFKINEASLPWGGLFDFDPSCAGDSKCEKKRKKKGLGPGSAFAFSSPHGGHRWGDQVDIRTNHLVGDFNKPLEGENLVGCSDSPPEPQPSECMDVDVIAKAIHKLQFTLMKKALKAGGTIGPEGIGNHFHVTFEAPPAPMQEGGAHLLSAEPSDEDNEGDEEVENDE